MGGIRPCRDDERAEIVAIVNAAAEAYRGSRPCLLGLRGRRRVGRHHGHPACARLRARLSRAEAELLETYWTIPDRQIEISVVLANPPLGESG
jgi:hypothetical protein